MLCGLEIMFQAYYKINGNESITGKGGGLPNQGP